MRPFIGREKELNALKALLKKRTSSLVVLMGRRRIGKSRLCEEFSKSFPRSVVLTGLPPRPGNTAQSQRNDFAVQLEEQLGLNSPRVDDWYHLFAALAKQVRQNRVLLVLDEITWMGSEDPDFLGKLKNAWDLLLSPNPKLILILSGSLSAWVEDNILKSTGFFGRVSLELQLTELPLNDCAKFWGSASVSAHEKLRFLAVTGGVPRYLEEIDPQIETEKNIRRLCFSPRGLLVREYDRIFADLFGARTATYKAILQHLSKGPATASDIMAALGKKPGGTYQTYLDTLVRTGYLSRDNTWHLKTGVEGKLSHFRLADNYLRFYLKYIGPNLLRIERGTFTEPPGWSSILGLQFENLVLQSRQILFQIMGVRISEIVYENPYFRRATRMAPGCQIDYLVQTRHGTLYLCEMKFTRKEIGMSLVHEIAERIKRLRAPRGMSVRPVLIHASSVTPAVLESEFFATIVDISQMLE